MIYLFVVVASLVAGLQAAPLSDRQPPVAMSDQLQPESQELLHLVDASDCGPDCTTEVWHTKVHGKAPGTEDVWQTCGTRIQHRKQVEFGQGRLPIILACAAVARHYPNCSMCMPEIHTFPPPEPPPSPPMPPSKPPPLSPLDWGKIHAATDQLPPPTEYLDHPPNSPWEHVLQVLRQDPVRGVHILRKEFGRLLASDEAA